MVNITIDLTRSQAQIWKQIEEASKVINKKPWYKRLFSWS